MRPGRLARCVVLGVVAALTPEPARAQETPPALEPDAEVEIAPAPESDVGAPSLAAPPKPFAEAPPPRPRKKGLVLETTLGVLGFVGLFGKIAPPGFSMRAQLGYEASDWLMFFGEGELSFTSTSGAQDESQAFAFPIWGFGGGARATIHASPRVAFFVQGELGALTADVPHDALTILGFRNAESLGASFGARVGVEWYQIDRHLALCAQGGARDALGFASVTASDTGLLWDAGLGARYVF